MIGNNQNPYLSRRYIYKQDIIFCLDFSVCWVLFFKIMLIVKSEFVFWNCFDKLVIYVKYMMHGRAFEGSYTIYIF